MTISIEENPFSELPEALVVDMLSYCGDISTKLSKSFSHLYSSKDNFRSELLNQNLLIKDSELFNTPLYPTTCGIDGSYTVEKLLSTDIVASASVAVEGLAPPSEVRHWPKPRHYSQILTINHNNSTTAISRAIMMCMELSIAVKAPHNVVLLDGSLTTPLVIISQALNSIDEADNEIREVLLKRLNMALASYVKILSSKNSDQAVVGVPKYTSRNDISKYVLKTIDYEDRSLLSFILKPGELVGPRLVDKHAHKWYLNNPPPNSESLLTHIIELLDEISIVYYRPYDHIPALRIEIPSSVAHDSHRLSMLLEAIKSQCEVPGILEPYPLYLADRMVKHLRTALPAIRKTITQEMTSSWPGSYADLYFTMHGYRTEWGK